MAEAMKARIQARVEATNVSLESAQESSQVRAKEAEHAKAAAEAAEENAKARARMARKDKEKAELDRKAKETTDAEASALRLYNETEKKRAAKAKLTRDQVQTTAQPTRSIDTAAVELSPFEYAAQAMASDADPEEVIAETPSPRAKKSAMRGTSRHDIEPVNTPAVKKDVDYYLAAIAAAEILGKHKTAEKLYQEARKLGFKLPDRQLDRARARQPGKGTGPAAQLPPRSGQQRQTTAGKASPFEYAKQEMDNEDSEEPESPASPVLQVMERPQGASEPIEAVVEGLGSTLTVRLQHASYDTGDSYTKAVEGTLPIMSASDDNLVLHFSSKDRTRGNLNAKVTTGDEEVVLIEFYREGARIYGGVSGSTGKNVCEVTVGGIVHGSIPGGDSVPAFRRTCSRDGVPPREGGVELVQGCICCPCQTQKNQLLVSPGGTEVDASLYSVQDGCDTCRMDRRKMVCKLPGNAQARLEILIMFGYMAASLLTMSPG